MVDGREQPPMPPTTRTKCSTDALHARHTAVIALLMRSPARLLERLHRVSGGDVGLSAIVLHELLFGAHASRQPERNLQVFRELQQDFPVVDFNVDDAHVAGKVRAELKRKGTPIGPYAVLVAGHAKARHLCLVTNNRREFERVEGRRARRLVALRPDRRIVLPLEL